MEDHLLLFLSKCKRLISMALVMVILGGLCNLAFNEVVKKFVPKLANLTAERLKIRIEMDNAHYAFPNRIILEGLRIIDPQDSALMLEVGKMSLDYSFPLALNQGKIHLDQITFDSPTVRVPAVRNYLVAYGRQVSKEFQVLPRANLKFLFNDIQLYMFTEAKTVAPLNLNLEVTFNNGQFKAKGKDRHSFLQLWGDWQSNQLSTKGFIFYDGPLFKKPLYILDIDGQVIVDSKNISLKKLSFSINGDEFSIFGKGVLQMPFQFESTIGYRRESSHISVSEPLIDFEATINGQMDYEGTTFNGHTDFDLFSNEKLHMPIEKISVEFKGLRTNYINDSLLQLKVNQGQLGVLTYKNDYKIDFENLLASLKKAEEEDHLLASLSTQLYGGNYHGQMIIDMSHQSWQVQTLGTLERIDISRLGHLVKYFNANNKGSLSMGFALEAPKNMSLKATMAMREGDFADLSFLPVDVSKIFQMPSLDHLSKADLFLRFKMDEKGTSIERFKLHSNNVNLNGFFKVNANRLVDSQVSVMFPKNVFNESPIGQRVIELVPEASQLPFQFHFSGNMQRMNFRWDDSPLKRKIEEKMPNFVEHSIRHPMSEKMSI